MFTGKFFKILISSILNETFLLSCGRVYVPRSLYDDLVLFDFESIGCFFCFGEIFSEIQDGDHNGRHSKYYDAIPRS